MSNDDEQASRAVFDGPRGGFLLNWPYVYAAIQANVKDGHEALAFQAIRCLTSPAQEKANMLKAGNPVSNGTGYDDPEIQKQFPMAALMRESINAAGPRPVTPYYGHVSSAIQRDWHPESSLNPNHAPAASAQLIRDVLHDRRLL